MAIIYEMLDTVYVVGAEGWMPMRTGNLNELSKIDRYEYVLEKELYDANKGIFQN